MATHIDPTSHMSPGQHQSLHSARTGAIGSATEATATLGQLDTARGRIVAGMRAANRQYNETTTLPELVGEDVARAVREQAETAISEVETASRRDLAVLVARAQSIVSQLADAANEPSLTNVPNDVLDGANRFAPLITSQLAGQPLTAIAKRLKSAVIRDDQSELLALSMILSPLLAGKLANPGEGDDLMMVYDLKDTVKQITNTWRDTSLDGALDQAQDVAKKLVDLDAAIMRDYQQRTDDEDPFGFLRGVR